MLLKCMFCSTYRLPVITEQLFHAISVPLYSVLRVYGKNITRRSYNLSRHECTSVGQTEEIYL